MDFGRTAAVAALASGLALAGGAQASTLTGGVLDGIPGAPDNTDFFVAASGNVEIGLKATAGPDTTLVRDGNRYLFNPFDSAFFVGTPLFNLFWSVNSAAPSGPSLTPLFDFDDGLWLELTVTGPGITSTFRDVLDFDAYYNDTANAPTVGTLGSLPALGGSANIAQNFIGFGPGLGGVNYDIDLPDLGSLMAGSVYKVLMEVSSFDGGVKADTLVSLDFDLEVVPLPGALPLLAGGLGLLGLMGWRRRRA